MKNAEMDNIVTPIHGNPVLIFYKNFDVTDEHVSLIDTLFEIIFSKYFFLIL